MQNEMKKFQTQRNTIPQTPMKRTTPYSKQYSFHPKQFKQMQEGKHEINAGI